MSAQSHELKARDKARSLVLDALKYIRESWPYWNRTNGRDHVWMFTHDQGACLDLRTERGQENALARKMHDSIRNSIFLSTVGDRQNDCYDHTRDVVIPPMVEHQIISSSVAADWATDRRAENRAKTHFASFRGQFTLEKAGDPWYAVVMLYGPWEQQPQGSRVAPSTAGCWKQPELSLNNCAMTCESELARSRIYSRGARQRMKAIFEDDASFFLPKGSSTTFVWKRTWHAWIARNERMLLRG